MQTEPEPGLNEDDQVAWFEAVFTANHDDLLRYALRRVPAAQAPDVVADVFLVAWRRRAEVPREAARLWLFGVAARVVANATRAQDRRARLAGRVRHSESGVVEDPAEAATTGVQVRAALATLPAADQEALRLTEWDGLSVAEAAAVLGCSAGTLRVRLHRARRRLAAALEAHA